jgi:hypothetical protein
MRYAPAAHWDRIFRTLRDGGADIDWGDQWTGAFAPVIHEHRVRRLLDLGCGTGNDVLRLAQVRIYCDRSRQKFLGFWLAKTLPLRQPFWLRWPEMVARHRQGSGLNDATPLWERWQALLGPCAPVFTRPGWGRVVPWVSGRGRCWAEPTLTPILTALGLEARWRVLEHCAAYGAGDRDAVERQTRRLSEQERPARWARDPPVAVDATTRHRTRAKVWGPCPVHASSARSPHRAATVRAHHWGGMGDLGSGTPWR